jgi:hypothetical protein
MRQQQDAFGTGRLFTMRSSGLWNAMNSLGAGGAETPYLVNAANALVFGLSRLSKSKSSSKAPERFRLTLMF